MISAWINGVKRQPKEKGEITQCIDCGGKLSAVISPSKISHWRHSGGDCDSWSESEGEWHLKWKSLFPIEYCENTLTNEHGDQHRADVLIPATDESRGIVLELQHSSITYDTMLEREIFYKRKHKMFWLVHLFQDNKVNTSYYFNISLNDPIAIHDVQGKKFEVHEWIANGNFLQKWKKSTAHVFLDVNGRFYYLATMASCEKLVLSLSAKQFAIVRISPDVFYRTVGITK